MPEEHDGESDQDLLSAAARRGLKAIVVSRAPKQKIVFIQQIRSISGLGLMEAKELAEREAPYVLVEASEDLAAMFVQTAEQQLGETGVFEIYDAEAGLQPAITQAFSPEALLWAVKTGCFGRAAAILLTAGVGVWLAVW